MFGKRYDPSVRPRTREDRATNTSVVRATYEPFGLATPTRGNAVLREVKVVPEKEKTVCGAKRPRLEFILVCVSSK